jgi:hypothetical protein
MTDPARVEDHAGSDRWRSWDRGRVVGSNRTWTTDGGDLVDRFHGNRRLHLARRNLPTRSRRRQRRGIVASLVLVKAGLGSLSPGPPLSFLTVGEFTIRCAGRIGRDFTKRSGEFRR